MTNEDARPNAPRRCLTLRCHTLLRIIIIVAVVGLLWLWAQYSFNARPHNPFTRGGGWVYFMPAIPAYVITGAGKEIGLHLNEERVYGITFFIVYGGLLGIPILQPFKRMWLNFFIPAFIWAAATACCFLAFIYAMGAHD